MPSPQHEEHHAYLRRLRDVAIEIDGDAPPVSADAAMLGMVFQNLLINVVHYVAVLASTRVLEIERQCHGENEPLTLAIQQ